MMLKRLEEKDLPVKLSKYEFHKHSIVFLGYIMSTEGIGLDPTKLESINS